MGHRTIQRILECAICEKTPDDGEYMWEMNGEHWCEECCDREDDVEEIPALEGTRLQLNDITIIRE